VLGVSFFGTKLTKKYKEHEDYKKIRITYSHFQVYHIV
jgi:hypothetical protein